MLFTAAEERLRVCASLCQLGAEHYFPDKLQFMYINKKYMIIYIFFFFLTSLQLYNIKYLKIIIAHQHNTCFTKHNLISDRFYSLIYIYYIIIFNILFFSNCSIPIIIVMSLLHLFLLLRIILYS